MNNTKSISKKVRKDCLNCGISFLRYPSKKRPIPMFCSRKCSNSSSIQLKKMEGKYYMQRSGMFGVNAPTFGKKWKIKDTSKMSLARILSWKKSEDRKKKLSERMSGENHPNWIKDRNKLVKRQERNDSAYKGWRKSVWVRDNYKCRISNAECKGRIEAHHILGWTAFPELRYQTNNGITLCHAHHPRKREDEAKLSPYFQKLVAEIN